MYKIEASLSVQDFNVQQKGSSRWTTLEEIQGQYREIDGKNGDYKDAWNFDLTKRWKALY